MIVGTGNFRIVGTGNFSDSGYKFHCTVGKIC